MYLGKWLLWSTWLIVNIRSGTLVELNVAGQASTIGFLGLAGCGDGDKRISNARGIDIRHRGGEEDAKSVESTVSRQSLLDLVGNRLMGNKHQPGNRYYTPHHQYHQQQQRNQDQRRRESQEQQVRNLILLEKKTKTKKIFN